jgi:pantothenate synthetase
VVDDATWKDAGRLQGPARALVAAWFGEVRLIDNLMLPLPGDRGGAANGGE